MISALDTNVLLDILIPNERFFERSLSAIQSAASTGSLVICDLVYAELCGHFKTQNECERFLHENRIAVERITRQAMWTASTAWNHYRKAGGKRERILPDFLIGAHALTQTSCLVTRDRGAYARYFKGLKLQDPSAI